MIQSGSLSGSRPRFKIYYEKITEWRNLQAEIEKDVSRKQSLGHMDKET
jgi:hypothetical protein